MKTNLVWLLLFGLIMGKSALSAECKNYGVHNQPYEYYGETLSSVYCTADGNTIWGLEAGLTSNVFKNNVWYQYLCSDANDRTCDNVENGITPATDGIYYFKVDDQFNSNTGIHYYHATWTAGVGWSNPGPTASGQLTFALESPSDGATVSGIGITRGWKCDADTIEIQFDQRDPVPAVYGNIRRDTAAVCGDTNNGFELLYNWSLLGDGPHEITFYADGVALGTQNFTVATLGYDNAFVKGLDASYYLVDFPEQGESTLIYWSQENQNFLIESTTHQQ